MYRERPSRIPGAVAWTAIADGQPGRILPDGCMDLMWMDDDLVIAGPDVRAFIVESPTGARITGLRFAPGDGPSVFGVPAHALLNSRVPLRDVWAHDVVDRLVERVAVATAPGRVLEEIAVAAYVESPDAELVASVVRGLRRGTPVARVATDTGLSPRHLQRKAVHAFGYGPKMLGRILRMNRALDIARSGAPFAAVASTAGYADQAHLARDVREFSGVTLGQLVASSAA